MPSPRPLKTRRAAGDRRRRRLWWTAAAIIVFAVIGAFVDSDDDEQSGSAVPEAGPSSTSGVPTSEPTTAARTDTSPTPPPTSTETASPGTALAMLAELEVKGRAPKTGYDREFFGWRDDTDRNGCDTRNDVLRRDLRDITLQHSGCVVLGGRLTSKFSGDTFDFIRGDGNNIDIDHLVSLSNAWQTGAQSFDAATAVEFGNDPLNLLAVESRLNAQKGDSDAATWLPPRKPYRCEYVSRQIAVKRKYELWVVPAEKEAMIRVLSACDDEPAFTSDASWPSTSGGDITSYVDAPTKNGSGSSGSGRSSSGGSGPGGSGSGTSSNGSGAKSDSRGSGGSGPGSGTGGAYKNCTEARDRGGAPVHVGEPGYGSHLDLDGDGIGCE